MAYEILKDDYYTQNISLPGGIPGVQRYGLRYDASNGDYVLSQKSAAGYTIGIGLAKLYENGSWTSDAIQDSKLFVDGDPTKMTPLAQQLSVDMRKKVYAAYQAKGGTAGGNVVNATARPANQNSPAGVNNSFPGTNPGISSAVPGVGGILSAPPGSINLNDITNLNFDSNNEEKIFKDSGLLLYPIDILKEQQDTLRITMYRYQPPAGDLFANPNLTTESIQKVFTQGLQRNSALKKSIATVVLPIPSGIQDNNAVGWGDDSMNNMTAAVTGNINRDPTKAIAGQAAMSLAGSLGSAFGVTLPTQTLTHIATLIDTAGITNLPSLMNNQQIKAAISSLLLKNAGFEVPAETILARGYGIVPNSNLELLFQGPTLRQFGFSWRMSPRSAKEATNVKRIIRMFKQGSSARKLNSQSGAGAASVFLGTPNVFKLSYKTAGNKEISGLNKFKICALVNMNVIYAPDGQWAAYAEGQPVSLQMSLNFQEIEPVYESDYQTDIAKAFKGNLRLDNYSSVNDNDVGY
jgi:hypothetical protein